MRRVWQSRDGIDTRLGAHGHLPTRAGSHTSLVLLDYGYSVVIIDNLENSKFEAFRRLKELAGDKKDRLKFVEVRRSGWLPSAWGCLFKMALGGWEGGEVLVITTRLAW